MIGTAVYFLADAAQALRHDRKIRLDAARSFTFAMVYLLAITALSGLDLVFCNAGRAVGMTVTLLAARQYHQNGGTLLGALTACGTVLCSVSLGTPMLFLPVTAMLAGFLHKLPNAVYIPVFFLMQGMSAAVLDSSAELAKVLVELLLSCCAYGLCSRAELYRILEIPVLYHSEHASGIIQGEQFLSGAIADLRTETAAVLRHLKPGVVQDSVAEVRESLCKACKNEAYCWKQRRECTEEAFRRMLHHPEANYGENVMDSCIRRGKMTECFMRSGHRAALMQSQNAQLSQNRSMLLEYLSLLEEVTAAAARRRSLSFCEKETACFREILRKCGYTDAVCSVHRLRSGRYTARFYTGDAEKTAELIGEMLGFALGVKMCSVPQQKSGDSACFCFYEQPAFTLSYTIRSITAPAYKRCGDTARAFTDACGNTYLILSDGMGSGSTASLVSELAVRTFSRLVGCGMEEDCVIRLINAMLVAEMGTEHFATLDILKMDADSGELSVYKSGAAATLLYDGSKVTKIEAPSFPVGILASAEPYRKRIMGRYGQRIIMLSDGIHEAEFPYIKELLLRNPDRAQLIDEICSKAGVFHAGEPADDITVITADISAEVPSKGYSENPEDAVSEPVFSQL